MLPSTPNTLPIDSIFNQELVDRLPGIFYLYEVVDGKAYLKRWNSKHQEVTERSYNELLNASLLSFFNTQTVPYILDCFSTILETGSVKNVYANILTASGNETPYVFEGYHFLLENKEFFMGMGMDITDLMSAKEQIKRLELQKLEKEKELFSIAIQEQKKEELLQNVLLKLEDIDLQDVSRLHTKEIKALTNEIKNQFSLQDNWQVFKKMFGEIHYSFFNDLKQQHSNLTKGELQYCAYLKIQMHSSEICNVLNISKDGLAKKRYRLKKKLGLDKSISLDVYITSF